MVWRATSARALTGVARARPAGPAHGVLRTGPRLARSVRRRRRGRGGRGPSGPSGPSGPDRPGTGQQLGCPARRCTGRCDHGAHRQGLDERAAAAFCLHARRRGLRHNADRADAAHARHRHYSDRSVDRCRRRARRERRRRALDPACRHRAQRREPEHRGVAARPGPGGPADLRCLAASGEGQGPRYDGTERARHDRPQCPGLRGRERQVRLLSGALDESDPVRRTDRHRGDRQSGPVRSDSKHLPVRPRRRDRKLLRGGPDGVRARAELRAFRQPTCPPRGQRSAVAIRSLRPPPVGLLRSSRNADPGHLPVPEQAGIDLPGHGSASAVVRGVAG